VTDTLREAIAAAVFVLAAISLYNLRHLLKGDREIFLRMFGGAVVLILALFANSSVVYSFSVLFVATFITNLHFIENITALIFGRSEFWKYRQATPGEVRQKAVEEGLEAAEAAREAQRDGSEFTSAEATNFNSESLKATTARPALLDAVQTARNFEENIIAALRRDFPSYTVQPNQAVQAGPDRGIIDVVLSSLYVDLVVEIKFAKSTGQLRVLMRRAAAQVKVYSSAYASIIGYKKWVMPIVVVPYLNDLQDEINHIDGVQILYFDASSQRFINLDKIRDYIAAGLRL
jgi:hypothetical protein